MPSSLSESVDSLYIYPSTIRSPSGLQSAYLPRYLCVTPLESSEPIGIPNRGTLPQLLVVSRSKLVTLTFRKPGTPQTVEWGMRGRL